MKLSIKNFINYLKDLLDVTNSASSKSFALLISTLTGGLIALIICFILVWDVVTNGYIKTDLADLGLFLLCVGGYIAGSGINKTMSERYESSRERLTRKRKQHENDSETTEEVTEEVVE